MKILIIEDSVQIIDTVSQILQLRWPEATMISTTMGKTGLHLLDTEHPDVVILDLGLPDIDGFQVLHEIRLVSDVPVIILTVRSEEINKIKGLESGADDYIVKPFLAGEFLARVRAAVRRRQEPQKSSFIPGRPFIRGELRVDFISHEVCVANETLRLSPSEYELLQELVMHEGQTVSYQKLLQSGWGSEKPMEKEYVDVYLSRLKTTLESKPGHPVRIQKDGELGYKLISR